MRIIAAAMLAALVPVAALAADTPPPAGAMKLSAIIGALEARVGDGLAYIDEVDWDDDGYWEVEYKGTDGSSTEVKLDPATGEPRT